MSRMEIPIISPEYEAHQHGAREIHVCSHHSSSIAPSLASTYEHADGSVHPPTFLGPSASSFISRLWARSMYGKGYMKEHGGSSYAWVPRDEKGREDAKTDGQTIYRHEGGNLSSDDQAELRGEVSRGGGHRALFHRSKVLLHESPHETPGDEA